MDYIIVKIRRLDWEQFRDACVTENERSENLSHFELTKNFLTKAFYAHGGRREDPSFAILLSCVRQALMMENASKFQCDNPTGTAPPPQRQTFSDSDKR